MSINLHLYAEREVYDKQGCYLGIQKEKYDLWQTPTKITFKILESNDILEEYKNWLINCCQLEVKGCYFSEDIVDNFMKEFNNIPYDYYIYIHYGILHFRELLEWKSIKEHEGFTLKFEAW